MQLNLENLKLKEEKKHTATLITTFLPQNIDFKDISLAF